jgi:hypothetical protein
VLGLDESIAGIIDEPITSILDEPIASILDEPIAQPCKYFSVGHWCCCRRGTEHVGSGCLGAVHFILECVSTETHI